MAASPSIKNLHLNARLWVGVVHVSITSSVNAQNRMEKTKGARSEDGVENEVKKKTPQERN